MTDNNLCSYVICGLYADVFVSGISAYPGTDFVNVWKATSVDSWWNTEGVFMERPDQASGITADNYKKMGSL